MEAVGEEPLPGDTGSRPPGPPASPRPASILQCSEQLTPSPQDPDRLPLAAQPLSKSPPEEFCQKSAAP